MKDPIPELRTRLRNLRAAAGEPPFDVLHRHAALLGFPLPVSTAHDLVAGHRVPRWTTVESFVRACVHHARSLRLDLPEDVADTTRWRSAYDAAVGASKQDARRAPCQLPLAPRRFTDRRAELTRLDGTTSSIFLIMGLAGTGKTSLALHWAHRHTADFPDGQLYLDMRGFGPTGTPLSTGDAARCLLDALGVDPKLLPADPQSLFGLLRSTMTGRRLLVLLDNVHDSITVQPLLPGDRSSFVLITSRNRLSALVAGHDAAAVVLDTLDEEQSRVLLAEHVGPDRVTAEPAAVKQLLRHCAGLPLALSIVAARVAAHPSFPLSAVSSELRQTSSRLNALDAGELTVNLRTVFSWSYDDLTPEAATLLTLLGSAPGADIGIPAAAALTDRPADRTRALLDELDRCHLVQQHQPGRFRMHDLVRAYAREQADRHDTDAALYRLICFYLHTADHGDNLLDLQMQPITLSGPARVLPIANSADALAWFTTEHRNLLAAQRSARSHGWHDLTWQLAWTFDSFHYHQGHLQSNVASWRQALDSARRSADPAAVALAERYFGRALARAGRSAEAVRHLFRALDHTNRTEDRYGQAHVHYSLGWAFELGGDDERALLHSSLALRLFHELGDPTWEARLLTKVGWYHARLGHHEQATGASMRALAAHRRLEDEHSQVDALITLGMVARATGRHAEARDRFRQSVDLCRKLRHSYAEATALIHLGDAHEALNQPGHARRAWRTAIGLLRSQQRTAECAQVAGRLGADRPAPPRHG